VFRAKAGFFWAGCSALCLIWAFFRLPETKGKTFAELDLLYEKGVPARKFRDAKPNIGHLIQNTPTVVPGAVEKR